MTDAGIRCMLMRGGSSKGAYFVSSDLPATTEDRDRLLLEIMGTPDPRQVDGIGGAHPLTSKVAIVGPSRRADADLEYLFLQVGVAEAMVTDRQNCGNLLAGVGPFAVERGLVAIDEAATEASLTIHMLNTDSIATATFPVVSGHPVYAGATGISGVPGTAAPIRLDFADIATGSAGALLPSGKAVDSIDGVRCTLIDAGMPVVVMRADELGVTGYESPAGLEANDELRARLESIRLQAGKLMGLGDVAATTVPKLTLVAPPRHGGALCTRTFIPHRCHDAIGVMGAVSVAIAALLPDTPANELLVGGEDGSVVLEHPAGFFEAPLEFGADHAVARAGIIRTARKLMDGVVFARPHPSG